MDRDTLPGEGRSVFEVTIIARGIDARAASFSDYRIVFVKANNAINAQIVARDFYNASIAFDARVVE